jgi:hypothetical protein
MTVFDVPHTRALHSGGLVLGALLALSVASAAASAAALIEWAAPARR